MEGDEGEARAEPERRDAEGKCAQLEAAEADPSERNGRARELRDQQLSRREQEETEHEARLVRRERDELGAVACIRDVQLGDDEDEKQHPQLRHRGIERAAKAAHAEGVDDRSGGGDGNRDDSGPHGDAHDAARTSRRGRSHGLTSDD